MLLVMSFEDMIRPRECFEGGSDFTKKHPFDKAVLLGVLEVVIRNGNEGCANYVNH